MDSSIDLVREQALANFDALLDHWNLEYKKISAYEYDIIASWRKDNSYGGCRFNVQKARGADFAGGGLSKSDFEELEIDFPFFDKEDFAGYTSNGLGKAGFDIVGLAQRVHRCASYKDTVGLISRDLSTIAQSRTLYTAMFDAAQRRARENAIRVKKSKQYAKEMWGSCRNHPFVGSVGEKYLSNRGIHVKDVNMRCHPGILFKGTKYPAIIFNVQRNPLGQLEAIHRIYLSRDGYKAKIDTPKMALAPIKGNGIWFGEKDHTLTLTEGPENALTLRELGCTFVCSSIFASNLHNIAIPTGVKRLVIWPDPDEAGMRAYEIAKEVYTKLDIDVEGIFIPEGYGDINDCLMGVANGGPN